MIPGQEIVQAEFAERAEKLRQAFFENIEMLAYELELDPTSEFRVSVVHLMEAAGDERTFAEIDEDEKNYLREIFRAEAVAVELQQQGLAISDVIDVRPDGGRSWIDVDILLVPVQSAESAETGIEVEKKHITYRNKCAYCNSEIVLDADVPITEAGKIKKNKKKGRYQDWDKEIDCPHCLAEGAKRPIILTFREFLDVMDQ